MLYRRIVKVGNSLMVTLPRKYLDFLKVHEKDYIQINLREDYIELRKPKEIQPVWKSYSKPSS